MKIPLFVVPIGRGVYIRCEGPPPTLDALDAAANAWLEALAPPPLVERALAWESKHPLEVAVLERDEMPGIADLSPSHAGAEEFAAMRRATHAVSVAGWCDASREGWLGVGSYARGIARAFDGVIVDHHTMSLRPLDERSEPLAEVTVSDASRTLSAPRGANRWVFLSHGLGNFGIPEVWFDGVSADRVTTAAAVIQSLRETLAELAQQHARRPGGCDGFDVGAIDAPDFGKIRLAPASHPFCPDVPAVRAHAAGRQSIDLGRLLRPGRPVEEVGFPLLRSG